MVPIRFNVFGAVSNEGTIALHTKIVFGSLEGINPFATSSVEFHPGSSLEVGSNNNSTSYGGLLVFQSAQRMGMANQDRKRNL